METCKKYYTILLPKLNKMYLIPVHGHWLHLEIHLACVLIKMKLKRIVQFLLTSAPIFSQGQYIYINQMKCLVDLRCIINSL